MKSFFKNMAFASVCAMAGISSAQAVIVKGTGLIQGGGDSTFTWYSPGAKTYKLSVFVPPSSTAAKARYRIYPKGKSPTSTVCSATDATYPCYEIFVNQSLNNGKTVPLKTSTMTSWTFTLKGIVTVWTGNLVNTVKLGVAGLTFTDTATTKYVTTKAIGLAQGAKDSTFNWAVAPALVGKTVNVLAYVPATATATKVRYRIYPKGKNSASATCSSTDATYPCFESFVNQAVNKNKMVSLKIGAKYNAVFTSKGMVSAWAGSATSTTKAGFATIDFRLPLKIGQPYQGGLIFYLNATQQHGYIAAKTDQSTSILWDYNTTFVATGATLTGIADGLSNTTKIVSVLKNGTYAARLCADATIKDTSTGKSYSDWYLPSKDQLNAMYNNIGKVATSVGKFDQLSYYWSSSEASQGDAWTQFFGPTPTYGSRQQTLSKNFSIRVRAVRSF